MKNEGGAALIVAVLTLTMVGAVAAALALNAATDAMLAAEFERAHEARYAAEAGLERAIADLPAIVDWNALAGGLAASTFVDGPPLGGRTLADGSTLELSRVPPTPAWHLFAYGPIDALLPGGRIRSRFYIVALVAAAPSVSGTQQAVWLRCEAFGPRGSHQMAQAVLEPSGDPLRPVRTRIRHVTGVP